MYECDCTEGYELNKNGYSCQGKLGKTARKIRSIRTHIEKKKQQQQQLFMVPLQIFSFSLSPEKFVAHDNWCHDHCSLTYKSPLNKISCGKKTPKKKKKNGKK